MASEQIQTRFPEHERSELAALEAASGESPQAIIRRLVRDAAGRLTRGPDAVLVDNLLNTFGGGASLTIHFAGSTPADLTLVVDVTPDVDSELAARDPDAPFERHCMVATRSDDPGRLTLEIVPLGGDPRELGARVWVATLPLQPSASVTIKLLDLHPVAREACAEDSDVGEEHA